MSLFPLDNYDQTITTWIKPESPDYDKPLLSPEMQRQHSQHFYKKYLSPWDISHINHILKQVRPDDLKTIEQEHIRFFDNANKSEEMIGYGENFRPHPNDWITSISDNMNLDQLNSLSYQATNRAIAIDNLHARVLPTDDVHFYSHKLAGQGYPFDNLQMSAIWIGTPLYIIAESKDGAWSLVIAPDYISWVKASGIARTSDAFVLKWQHQAIKQLAVITQTKTSLTGDNHHFLASAFVGTVFPAIENGHDLQLMVPAADERRFATVRYASVSKDAASTLPLSPTARHFANIIGALLNRPYGWGNMYFYNDCSSEIKSIFAAFGVWLPRHSSEQVSVGNMTDLSSATPSDRLAYLTKHGRKFVTIVYINGHVFMYIGKYNKTRWSNDLPVAMTYQNVWGLKPSSANVPQRRAVIGQSVFFPLLLQYPEDNSLKSQLNTSEFKVSFLDEPTNYVKKPNKIDLRSMMDADN